MESVVINVSRKRVWIFNGFYFAVYICIGILLAIVYPTIPLLIIIIVSVWAYLHFDVFNRLVKFITKISIDEKEIVLNYYVLLFLERSITINKDTYLKTIVKERKNEYSICIHDKTFVNPPFPYRPYYMQIVYSKSILSPGCEKKEDIESVIKLLYKYGYFVIYDNS